jgi:hypothetical protein
LRLLILGVFAILASAVSVLLPVLSTAFPRRGDIGRVFWVYSPSLSALPAFIRH